MPFAADSSHLPIELLQQEWRKVNGPAMNGCMINGDATFCHHLLEIVQAQAVSQVPPDAQQDHQAVEVAAFEHVHLRNVPEAHAELSY